MSNVAEPARLPILRAGLAQLGLELDALAAVRFQRYFELLEGGAAPLGLTTVVAYEDVQRRHFLESAALGSVLKVRGLLRPGVRLLDLGSGAGLPGIPVKILFPNTSVTLVEATGKKAGWLRDAVAALELDDVTVLAARAEDLGRDPAHRERYDVVTARAVAPLRVLLELAAPLLTVGGVLAAIKGERGRAELHEAQEAARVLTLELEAVALKAPYSTHEQVLVLARKKAKTPERFPRRAGIPARRPL